MAGDSLWGGLHGRPTMYDFPAKLPRLLQQDHPPDVHELARTDLIQVDAAWQA